MSWYKKFVDHHWPLDMDRFGPVAPFPFMTFSIVIRQPAGGLGSHWMGSRASFTKFNPVPGHINVVGGGRPVIFTTPSPVTVPSPFDSLRSMSFSAHVTCQRILLSC